MTETDKPAVFFLHIPKTAGTSITQVIDQHYDTDDIFPHKIMPGISSVRDFDKIGLPRPLKDYKLFRGHFKWSLFKEFEALSEGQMRPFTFLRDPVARHVSIYYHRRRDSLDQHQDDPARLAISVAAREKNLKDFLAADYLRPDEQINMLFPKGKMPDDEALDLAIERLKGLSMFGLAEATSESIMLMNAAFGWRQIGTPPLLNIYHGQREPLNPDILELILAQTRLDRAFYRKAQDIFWDRLDLLTAARERPRRYALPARIEMASAITGVGWHTREGGPPNGHAFYWRWSGPGCHSRLDVLLEQPQDLRVELSILNIISPEIQKTLQFSINGHVLPTDQRSAEGGGVVYGMDVPAALAGRNDGLMRIGIHAVMTRTFNELNPSVDDFRAKAVAVTLVDILPRPEAGGSIFTRMRKRLRAG